MGNTVGKNNCCSNQFGHNKKEVDIDENENIRFNGELPIDKRGHETTRDHKYAATPQRQDPKPEIRPVEIDTRDLERIKKLEQIVAKAPVLLLKVVNSTMLPKGTVIKMNAQGVEGSLRNRKDGITYFGCKKKSKPLDPSLESVEVVNDYIIRNKDSETNDRHRGRHFQIEYNIESSTYKIRDLGVGFGAFVKIEHPLLLRDNNLLSMGSSFLIVNLDEEGAGKESLMYSNSAMDLQEKLKEARLSRQSPFSSPLETENKPKQSANGKKAGGGTLSQDITVKIFGGPNYGEVYQFNSTIPVIRIGRMPDCEVRIEDSLLSKYQGSMKYVADNGWFLYDGLDGKPSTNSNWLYLNDDFEMYDGMVFKANHTLFQVEIEKK